MGISNMSKNHCIYLYWCKRNKHVPKQGKIVSQIHRRKVQCFPCTCFIQQFSCQHPYIRCLDPESFLNHVLEVLSFFLFVTVNCLAKQFLHGGHSTQTTRTHTLMHTCMHVSHTSFQVQIQDCSSYLNVEMRDKIKIYKQIN